MSASKTVPTDVSVLDFIHQITHPVKKADSLILLELITKITGTTPVMWGPSIIGYDTYHYTYASGREGDWPIVGFSPRKQNISIYIMPGFDTFKDKLAQLGKHKTSVSCLYINKLADVDLEILTEIITQSVAIMRKKYHKK